MKQLEIFGEVGDWFIPSVNWFLKELEDKEEFELAISSPGGNALAGISIYSMLKKHPHTVRVLGHASSIASVIMMSASEGRLLAEKGSLFNLHSASAISAGTAKEKRKVADSLDKITASAVAIYMNRFNGTEEELYAILDEDKFHTAEQMLEWGLIDKIVDEKDSASEEMFAKANFWMEDVNNIFRDEETLISRYVTMLSNTPQRPIETNIINNKNEDDAMSQDATLQAKYQEEFAQRVQLSADLKVTQTELADAKAKLQTLEENVANMTAEKSQLENTHTATVTELDALKASMAEVEKQKVTNEIEAFLNANDKKILPAQKDSFKMMLESAKANGEEQYKLAKESIEKMPENPLFSQTNDSARADNDDASMTVDEVKKINWNAVDFSTKEGDAMLTNAINVLMKADKELTSEQAENILLGGQ